jgi:drug/metabolite transporter (DMT)-like permease
LAYTLYGISAVFWLLALRQADLSFAYPFLSLTYIAVLFGGALLFHETVTFWRIGGFVVVIAGLLIIARGEQAAAKGSSDKPSGT